MMIPNDCSSHHLTYCLNVHPGESWADQERAIRTCAAAVRDRIAPQQSFGLGLRLSKRAVSELQDPALRSELSTLLAEQNMYVFTINGFPYGQFHDAPVKERVYQPDWRTASRRDYTLALADLLSDILPPDTEGSISTVPGSFKSWVARSGDIERMVRNLMDCVMHFDRLRDRTGQLIALALEPEPSCYLETTEETVCFFADEILVRGVDYLNRRTGRRSEDSEAVIRRHLGICFDTCHVALQFESLEESLAAFAREEIRIVKIQLSAALEVFNERTAIEALHPFIEPVYLHQVKGLTRHGAIRSWTDLPDALRAVKNQEEYERLRVHFHVPLFWEGTIRLGSTAEWLTPGFFQTVSGCGCSHLEIETYTFDVLPDDVWKGSLVDCLVREFEWALARLLP